MNRIHSSQRRLLLKSLLTAPFIGSGLDAMASQASLVNNRFGHHFKISLNVYSFNALLREGKIDLFDVLDFCAKYNFEAIDPTGYYFPNYPEVPTLEFINRFKREAFLLGLDISGTGVRNDFTLTDPAKRQADMALIKKWIETAASLGIPNLRVFAGKTKHEGFARDQVFEWMAKDVKACCEHGKRFGVMIAIQNHNDFLKTAHDVDRMFDMVNSDWLGLNLDIGSYRQHDPYEEIKRNIQHAVTWQIKENVWIEGKETPTDFVKLFKIIKAAGYRGYLPLETLGAGDPYTKVPRLLKTVQQALNSI
jgi:sugar phosphate isomerase/epimerase